MQNKKPRGRPTLPPGEAQTALIRERVTEAEWAKYTRLGGKAWLKKTLNQASENLVEGAKT